MRLTSLCALLATPFCLVSPARADEVPETTKNTLASPGSKRDEKAAREDIVVYGQKTPDLTERSGSLTVKNTSVGAAVNWQGRIWRDQGVLSTSGQEIVTRQHSYALLDLMAHYDLGKHWQLTGNLNNVSNYKYLTSLYWSQSYYGAPFSGSFTLTHQF